MAQVTAWVGHPVRALVVLALGLLTILTYLPTLGTLGLVLHAVILVALLINPKYPNATMVVLGATFSFIIACNVPVDAPRIILPVGYTIYLASANGSPKWRPVWLGWILLGTGIVNFIEVPFLNLNAQTFTNPWLFRMVSTITMWMFVGFFWLLGGISRRRQAEHQALQDRAELSAVVERTRIAREMHDIVAHNLSAVIALADGAHYANATNPDVGTEALKTIADTARDALTQMRGLLSVLRDQEARDPDAIVTVDALRGLLFDARRAGLNLTADGFTNLPDDLPQLTQSTVYRIVQELLTNMLKYAPDKRGHITATTTKKTLTIIASNKNPERHGEPGFGLIGMRERVAALGGTLAIDDGGDFTVTVVVPR
ncbi:MAG: histidine kinase [Corynebacterium sp.]|nr:histidine kinase [Corynebacterium sp.]